MATDRYQDQVAAALAAAEEDSASAAERAEMLVEIAMGLQQRPKAPGQLHAAVELYDKALSISGGQDSLTLARITARKATALQAIPGEGSACLEAARDAYQQAIPVLGQGGNPEEVAEAEMNLGLVLQALAAAGRARLTDAIAAYQRSLRVFDRKRFPQEFAILQNNLATAYLSMPLADERAKMREALAVQAFEEGLKVVTFIDHPAEYAMLQNNLGNALQYASTTHRLANNLRALEAYDEALKVRSRLQMPREYANTIANKANCLRNLPDEETNPEGSARANLLQARALYTEAREIFTLGGETDKAAIVAEALFQIGRELMDAPESGSGPAVDSNSQNSAGLTH